MTKRRKQLVVKNELKNKQCYDKTGQDTQEKINKKILSRKKRIKLRRKRVTTKLNKVR